MSVSTATCMTNALEPQSSKHVLILQAKVLALQRELKEEQDKVTILWRKTGQPAIMHHIQSEDLIQLEIKPENIFNPVISRPSSCDKIPDLLEESNTTFLRKESEELKCERTRLSLENHTLRLRLEVMAEFLKQEIAIKQSYFAIATMHDAERVIDLATRHGMVPPCYQPNQGDVEHPSAEGQGNTEKPSPRTYTIAEMYETLKQEEAAAQSQGKRPRACPRCLTREISKSNTTTSQSGTDTSNKEERAAVNEPCLPKNSSTQDNNGSMDPPAPICSRKLQDVTISPNPKCVNVVSMAKCALILDGLAPIGSPHYWQKGWEVYVSLDGAVPGLPTVSLTFKINKTKKNEAVLKKQSKIEVFTLDWHAGFCSGHPMITDIFFSADTVDGTFAGRPNILRLPTQDEVPSSLTSLTMLSYHHLSSPYQREIWKGLDQNVEETLEALFDFSRPHTIKIVFLNPWGVDFEKLGRHVYASLKNSSSFTPLPSSSGCSHSG